MDLQLHWIQEQSLLPASEFCLKIQQWPFLRIHKWFFKYPNIVIDLPLFYLDYFISHPNILPFHFRIDCFQITACLFLCFLLITGALFLASSFFFSNFTVKKGLLFFVLWHFFSNEEMNRSKISSWRNETEIKSKNSKTDLCQVIFANAPFIIPTRNRPISFWIFSTEKNMC